MGPAILNEQQLSQRLKNVTAYVEEGMVVADIGSDHAYLPCFLVTRGVSPSAVAGEVADGPLRSAKAQVEKLGLKDRIDVRKGDGLAVLKDHEVDCIIIAGMGGPLITSILQQGQDKLEGVSRLILQPNVGAMHIRRWLLENGWELKGEQILEESGKIYEILMAEPGEPLKPYNSLDKELLFGPFLAAERKETFIKKWTGELTNWRKVLEHMNAAQNPEVHLDKRKEIMKKISLAVEVLNNE